MTYLHRLTAPTSISRGTFLRECAGLFAVAAFSRPSPVSDRTRPFQHPEPRPDVTAERVLTEEALGMGRSKQVLAAYEAARQHPEIFDGLACGCGCTDGKTPMHRSLLVCYETMQPTGCRTCQSEARLVDKLAVEKNTLTDIRAAVDKEFG